ncbi:MAG: NAD(P)H-hydrate dehydratase, partial [Mycetocola sp.]
GDVLAGCLAALVATAAARGALTNNTLAGVAATAALIHATAAVQASSGGPLVALELATGLSRALASLLGH